MSKFKRHKGGGGSQVTKSKRQQQKSGSISKHKKDNKFNRNKPSKKFQKHEKRSEKQETGERKQKKIQNKSNQKSRGSKHGSDSESDFEEVVQSSAIKNVSAGSHFQTTPADGDGDIELSETRKLFQQQSRKKKKSGGFQSMGLSHPVYKGITRKGYKIPTPIQRKTIPLIMDGKDMVAMARTGSGKTAAFLIPMFERLKTHLTSGARGLILAPTRELALQTLKFTKELGRFTGLKFAVILGGDSMEEQFAAIHENPDVIIATPGRFMHVLVEMELKLSSVEYLVFDEADRLFEMGFQEQMREILQRVPENRQTVLFSATLPKMLVEFAKAGLHDPTLIRLDVDTKLSENLKMAFLQCQSENKMAALLHLLRNVVKPAEQTVIFAATKHHVEYINQVLLECGFRCSYSYSALDQTARKINVAKFRNKTAMILIVTDLAARGIDIPLLDNVINYNFPAKSKLFVHRVGRVARAGRSGIAYSLVSPDEVSYVLDLHLFLGRPLVPVEVGKSYPADETLHGLVPQSVIDDEEQNMRHLLEKHDIAALHKVMTNAYKQYIKSRPPSASESIKRSKELATVKIGYHPLYGSISADVEDERAKLLQDMKSFKPKGTIFEVNTNKKNAAFNVMKTKREYHERVIERNELRQQERGEQTKMSCDQRENMAAHQDQANEADVDDTFSRVVAPKANKGLFDDNKKNSKKRKGPVKDEENYVSYRPKDFQSERGFSMGMTSFDKEADNATMDITGDDAAAMKNQRSQLKWDRKRKKYINEKGYEPGKKRMKTESGQWISSTYKSNIYKDWLSKSKVADADDSDGNDEGDTNQHRSRGKPGRGRGRGRGMGRGRNAPGRSGSEGRKKTGGSRDESSAKKKGFQGNRKEIKPKEQILKERRKKQKLQAFMKHRENKKKGKSKR